jgi:phosphoribosylaminoimidazole synthetase
MAVTKPKPGAEKVYDPAKPYNKQIRELITQTHPKDGPITVTPLGKRFSVTKAGVFDNCSELTGVDGIGTKGLLHWQMGTMEAGAQDAFAMVVDDLIESGHMPVLMQDHIQIQEENHEKIYRIVKGLVDLAKANPWNIEDATKYPIVINGGETAIINTMQGFEVGITGTGFAIQGHEIFADAVLGDALIGIKSSGPHSNGYSFFRKDFIGRQSLKLEDKAPWDMDTTVGKELTIPTNVYLPAIVELIADARNYHGIAADVIHGMVHITGGGLSKLKELIPNKGNLNIEVHSDHGLMPQSIFFYSHASGVSSRDMYERFNNGIGYVVAVHKDYEKTALRLLRRHFAADTIGRVVKGDQKIRIRSAYDQGLVEF